MTDTTKLALKPTSKPIRAYYDQTAQNRQMGFITEGNMRPAFGALLAYCAPKYGYSLVEEYTYTLASKKQIRFDGVVFDSSRLRRGVWEAKDTQDDLDKEIQKKFAQGYPKDNILFQAPDRAVLYQNGRLVLDVNIDPANAHQLIHILELFLGHTNPQYEAWEVAIAEFKPRLPEIATQLDATIEKAYREQRDYRRAFDNFHDLCREAINPNLSKDAVEEMLIQHILTERIFRRVFNNDQFTRQNIIAIEIEKVVTELSKIHFRRDDFMQNLSHFYGAIEQTAGTIEDYSEKQGFLNTVYEQFFQGFSVAVADTHGIVYTPQPIVQFMVRSVEQLLRDQFGGRSLADEGVHILDPFVGTGNFMLRVIEEIRATKPSALPHKYAHELHCNEVMLLPYYIASMNIEHAYYEAMGRYTPFEGICLVDTFDLAEGRQMGLFTQANLERVERQRKAPLTVILGNPPYNANQVNENDNNKNRKYDVLDDRVSQTYSKASVASNKRHLSDPYVKSFRWASDRLQDEGVIAFVTNSGFVDGIAFDGMRKYLAYEFDAVYILDLGGNSRKTKRGEKVSNVFDIRVGVCITLLVRKKQNSGKREGKIYYYQTPETGVKADKFAVLDEAERYHHIAWREIIPTKKHFWLSDGMDDDFTGFLPMGSKEARKGRSNAIFELYSLGVSTNRDAWTYHFNREILIQNMQKTIEAYNVHVLKWRLLTTKPKVDDFVQYDDKTLSWSEGLKNNLKRGKLGEFSSDNIRTSLYRPFMKVHFYYDRMFNEKPRLFHEIFPTPATEQENRVICVAGIGDRKGFGCLMSNVIPSLDLAFEKTQCFPMYVYDEDGSNRRENISDWALGEYRRAYGDETITKSDIFYAVYALLHHPDYRERYAQNLKRELPRVPFVHGENPHPLTPSPLHGEGGLVTGEMGFPLPPFDGGRVGDGGGFDGDDVHGENPHPLTPSPLHGEGGLVTGEMGFPLPPFDGGRVGDGGDFDGKKRHIPAYTTSEMWQALKPLARQMRHEPTPAEKHLWGFVRKNQIAGKGFRRQHPIDRFIVDFYCHEARLVVEVDGEIHQYTQEHDAIRQAFLESLGLRVLRFSNDAVLNDTIRVLKDIEDAVFSLPPFDGGRVGDGGDFDGDDVHGENPHPLTPSPLHGEGGLVTGEMGFPLPPFDGGRVGDGGTSALHYLARLGRDLSYLHINYEHIEPYPLRHIENSSIPPTYRVSAMRLNKEKTAVIINDFLTLDGIPPQVFEYQLGNRSALEWVIDQYRIGEDKRSGIINDPNRLDDEKYIVELVKRVVAVSMQTVRLVDEIAKVGV